MKASFRSAQAGFTLIEIGLVVALIAILLTISYVGYNGLVNRAVTSAATNDLDSVKKNMEISFAKNGGKYPNFIPDDVKPSDGITLRLVESKPYTGLLSEVQSGVLFQQVCNQLITEGYGYGANLGGGTDQYITGCNVWGHGSMQINGWQARTFSTPLSSNTIYNWFDMNVSNEAWFPNKKQTYLDFATELTERYEDLGGEFPVNHFYDTWSSPYSYQPLPTPNAGYIPTEYCVEASHVTHTDLIWHVDQSGDVLEGEC